MISLSTRSITLISLHEQQQEEEKEERIVMYGRKHDIHLTSSDTANSCNTQSIYCVCAMHNVGVRENHINHIHSDKWLLVTKQSIFICSLNTNLLHN